MTILGGPTGGLSFSTATQRQLVAITGLNLNPSAPTAQGYTKQDSYINIDLKPLVGAVHVTPAIGEQWWVVHGGNSWVLQSKLPFNTDVLNTLAANPVPGQVQIGSSGPGAGPLQLAGSQVNANAPLRLFNGSTVTDVTGALPSPISSDIGSIAFDLATNQPVWNNGITWQSFGGAASIPTLAQLGTGTPDANNWLRGDGTWAPLPEQAGTAVTGPAMLWQGNWNNTQTYNADDVVFYNGMSYIALSPIPPNTPPAVTAAWQPLAVNVGGGGGTPTLPLAVKGDLLTMDGGGNLVRVPVGANSQVLIADDGNPYGMVWGGVLAAMISGIFDPSQIPLLEHLLGELLQSQVQNLETDLANLLNGVNLAALESDLLLVLNALGLGTFATVAAALPALTARFLNITSGGLFDASQLTNIANIPAIAQSSVTNLTTDLGTVNTNITNTWNTIIAAMGGTGSGLTGVTAALQAIPAENIVGAITTAADQALRDAIAVALGHVAGATASQIQSYMEAIPIPNIANLGGYLTNLSTSGVLALAGLASGSLPGGITLPGAQLTGSVSASLVSGALTGATLGVTELTGLAAGILTWLTSGGALPSATTLGASGLTGLATGIGTWLTGGGALPGATTLGATGLTGLATGVGTWLTGGGALPGATTLGATGLTGLATGIGAWITGGGALPTATTLAATGLTSGAIPAGVTLPGSQLSSGAIPAGVTLGVGGLTGLATGIGTWLAGGGALPGTTTLGASGLTGLATGISTWLTGGGALPSTTTLGATGLTGLATGIGTWLTGGGGLPAATTLAGSQLTGSVAASLVSGVLSGATLAASSLTGGAIPLGVTLPGAQLTGNVAASLINGVLTTGNIPNLPASQITSGTFTQGLIPALTSSWAGTLDGSRLVGSIAASLISGALSGATLAATALTSGAIPSGVTLPGGQLTGSVAASLISGALSGATLAATALTSGAIPSGVTLPGAQLTGSVAAALISGVLGTGNIPTLPPGQISGPGTFAANLIPSLPSGWGNTIDGSLLAGQVAGGIVTGIVSGNPITTDVQNTVDNLQSAITNAVSTGNAPAALYSGFSNYFTSLFNVWGGNGQILGPTDPNPAPASTVDVATAMANINTTITGNSANITSIQSQLPSFYGGGTGGLSMDTSLTPASAAPAGFNAATIQPGTPAAWPALVYATPATTDDFTVSGSITSSDGRTKFLFLRANSATAPTSYVYAWLQNNTPFTGAGNCKIGCVVAGVNTVFKTFALPSPGTLSANAAYDLAADVYTFTVSGPALTQSYVDSSHVSQMGTGYRYGGLGHTGWMRNVNQFGSSGTYTVPSWAASGTLFDIVGVGGGAGGQTPTNTGLYTNGGLGGSWNGAQPKYGTDIPLSTTTFGVHIGSGGAHGPTVGSAGGPGGNTTITATGYSTVTAAGGGVGTTGSGAGGSPGNYTYDNTGYTGGAAQGNGGAVGNAPGGGGSGGIWGTQAGYGGDGAPGGVWVRAIDTSAGTGPFNSVAVYDNAVAGPRTATVLTGESTSSTSPTDLATTTDQVTINVGSSGLVIVFINAEIVISTSLAAGSVLFALSGANTVAAGAPYQFTLQGAQANGIGLCGEPYLLAGLNPGATTFKMKYKSSSGTVTFSNRMISVIPL